MKFIINNDKLTIENNNSYLAKAGKLKATTNIGIYELTNGGAA